MVNAYYEKDTDLSLLKNRRIAVIGYGSQGHAHALNLQESGLNVCVGLRQDSASWEKAERAGLPVKPVAETATWGDIVMLLVPDQNMKKIYEEQVVAHLKPGNSLAFGHGFNIHYGQVVAPPDVDVWMVAPKSPGHLVRRTYSEGQGVPCLIAVHQNATGQAKELALAWAAGIGCARAGALETNFKDETETDLFGEQAVLCGGSAELVKAGFDTLVEAGYPPELAYFECMHELKLIVDLYYEGGLARMNYSVSDTAEYGGMTRGNRVITEQSRTAMREILKEVQDGRFAKEWIAENEAGQPRMTALRTENAEHRIEQVGSKLRCMMSWLKKN